MLQLRAWGLCRRCGLRIAWCLSASLVLAACGGGGESLPDMDLGSGIFITPDGAVVVAPGRSS